MTVPCGAYAGCIILALSACAESGGSDQLAEVERGVMKMSDSTVFETAAGNRWRSDLRISGERYSLVGIRWTLILPGGGVAFSQEQDFNVLFFNGKGELAAKAGSKGDGPGEFRNMAFAGSIGDSIWIWDAKLRRVTQLTQNGEFIRDFRMPIVRLQEGRNGETEYSNATPRGYYLDNTLLVMGNYPPEFSPTGIEIPKPRPLWIVSVATGSLERRIGELPPDSGWVTKRAGTSSSTSRRPFYAHPVEAFSADGRRVAWIQTTFGRANQNFYTVTQVSSNGDTIFSRHFPFVPEPIPQERIDKYLARRRASAERRPQFAQGTNLALDDIPSVYPPVDALLVSADGSVLVGLRADRNGRKWMILGPTGEVVDELRLPSTIEPIAASLPIIWARETDNDWVQSLVRLKQDPPR